MAVAILGEMTNIGDINHKYTTWEFYKDNKANPYDQNDLLFKSNKDRFNKSQINFAPRNNDGTLYDPLAGIIGRAKVFYNDRETSWVNIKIKG